MKTRSPQSYQKMLFGYIAGFAFSIILTLEAYVLVVNNMFAHRTLVAVVALLAVVQCMVQLLLFLHLAEESKPRWKFLVFGFMIMVISILVVGSLWIMSNLNYRMTPQQMNTYLKNQDGL